ncbi:DUF421 domain-containing protein [Nocardiopsis algeriensis]|uniref:Uncharacterized membrane protein YcaP (DUF421 family) n=1 Tax=Nocardiopsis algeriensis TaxID=1478215 RepID=A0A841IU38_9ACTN|nr:YetF domain-containing protein [Nocardiopsis algeriensis]MBB6120065.1 uncharacterized membrane protein YcaP (DUF421 family) [Nocardiopsis algeriensis]
MDWTEILVPSSPLLELIVRGSVTFLSLMFLLRLAGQRETGGLGLTDLLVVVLVADAAGAGMTGDTHTIADGLVLTVTMILWSVVLDAAAYRWPRFARIVKARPRPLISEGRLNHRVMRREFMSEQEVLSQLRLHGISDPSQVHRAYLEPNGMVSIIAEEGTNT